jgi:hypothetical protein
MARLRGEVKVKGKHPSRFVVRIGASGVMG